MDRNVIELYAKGAGALGEAIKGLSREDFLATPVSGTWSIQQIVLHLMDSDLIASDRMKRIIAEENPAIIGYHETAFSQRLFYEKQDPFAAAEIFRMNREMTALILRSLPESAFGRVGTHNERGKLTLAEMLLGYVQHLDHHLGFCGIRDSCWERLCENDEWRNSNDEANPNVQITNDQTYLRLIDQELAVAGKGAKRGVAKGRKVWVDRGRREFSAGFILYRETAGGPVFLLLDYGKHWDYPKGHLEEGETAWQAAVRELREETGIRQVDRVGRFAREMHYFFFSPRKGRVTKTVTFFLGRTRTEEVKVSDEHTGYAWLGYEEAMERLTYENAREMLRGAWEVMEAEKGW